ncbi:hypothetical protein [Actinomadura rubrisoli]|uniref:Uncharacterized protein n=1 Tax=Actinomadura rubrisoli TaxID=2530368 RepID=A0A4R5B237_9ACTN|nr:hypothetical protein [Actinomadura rubrisoli]TDD79053.1 hypothetical protein E1298_28660 [Actinomadura rubrisoli]
MRLLELREDGDASTNDLADVLLRQGRRADELGEVAVGRPHLWYQDGNGVVEQGPVRSEGVRGRVAKAIRNGGAPLVHISNTVRTPGRCPDRLREVDDYL